MSIRQIRLPLVQEPREPDVSIGYRERLCELLAGGLDFQGEDSGYASHNFHAFPARFPPQLPRKFISVG